MPDAQAILDAQAQGGSAAVQAYLTAQGEIAARQQAGIAAMSADSIARHSPDVAGQAAQAQIGSDALLNQLAIMRSNAGAEDASRQARMADYGRMATQAGGLIPLQARADADLIHAQGQTEIERMRVESEGRLAETRLGFENDRQAREREYAQRVGEIQWQMRAQAKKDAAEAARQAREDAKAAEKEKEAKKAKLSDKELQGMAAATAQEALLNDVSIARSKADKDPGQVKATRTAQGGYIVNPQIAKPVSPLRRILNPFANKPKSQTAPTPAETAASSGARRKAVEAKAGVPQAEARATDPQVMRDLMYEAAQTIIDSGTYDVGQEALASFLGGDYQPGMSAGELAATQQGVDTSSRVKAAADARAAEKAALDVALEPIRRDFSQVFGKDFDKFVSDNNLDAPTVATVISTDPEAFLGHVAALEEVNAKYLADKEGETNPEVWLQAQVAAKVFDSATAAILKALVL